ncbi:MULTISPECIES: hypothetical protein [unclassified Sagittula]|uniref:hypothetical protein n=1 Tax=unclassified Sagittula TaxID=2624628 RepID=UPI0024C33870|nr:hypothetical protein [Sagittula sp. MA-2]WHZ33533.1 hypothetical protein QNI11_12825 [Sagittula sp. MA-2]
MGRGPMNPNRIRRAALGGTAVLAMGIALAAGAVAQTEPVAQGALPPSVETSPLSEADPSAAGLLSPATTGLPVTLWKASDPANLAVLIAAVELPVPAMQRLMRTLILTEAEPPAGDARLAFLDGRLNWLTSQGAVEEALALLDITGVDDPRLFAHWVDLSLLLGQSEPVCDKLEVQPRLSSDLSLRVFCTARKGDWERAALILQSARTLGDISGRRAELLTRFLDPEAGDGRALLPPVRPSPLEFRLFEALGEPLPTAPLPLPFAVLDLSGDNGWRTQIEAAERLARAGSLPPNRLLGIYTLRRPAASGGIWDRVKALQDFEAALERGVPEGVARALVQVWPQMAHARMLSPFADLYAEDIAEVDVNGRAQQMARRARFLTAGYEDLSLTLEDDDGREARFLTDIARGIAPDELPSLPHAEAVAAGFTEGATMPQVLATQLDSGRLGEVILRAMALFASGAEGNGQDLTDAIATFRALGLEDTARRAALELMILDAERALQ